MTRDNRNHQQNGFTIIELMISISVFSVILLICMSAIIYVSRQYYKGVTLTKTQDVSRQILSNLTDAVKFNKEKLVPLGPTGDWSGAICVGTKKYSYKLDKILATAPVNDQSDEVLIESIDPNCAAGDAIPINNVANPSKELMGEHMRIVSLDLAQDGNGVVTVTLDIAYGGLGTDADDMEVFGATDAAITNCKSGPGSHFCAVIKQTKSIYGF